MAAASKTGATSSGDISEHNNNEEGQETGNSRNCKKPFNGNDEALAWAFDSIAGPVIFIALGLFLGTALLNLAKLAAGCEVEIPEGETRAPECKNRVHGVRPSSLITLGVTVTGLVTSILLPVVGAIIDHTSHRKAVGMTATTTIVVCMSVSVFVGESTWLIMVFMMFITSVAAYLRNIASLAYLPELTDDSDLLAKWTATYAALTYAAMLMFLIYMIGIAYIFDRIDDYVWQARVATITALVISSVLYGISWTRLFKPRPAFSRVPEEYSLVRYSFIKVTLTLKKLRSRYRGLMFFFISIALSEAGTQALTTVSITYMTDTLQMSTTNIGISILCIMFFSGIGTVIARFLSSKHLDPVRNMQLSLSLFVVTTIMAGLFLYKPGQEVRAYIISGSWGISNGMKLAVERFIICRIIPRGQDAEMMGFYLFCLQILVWLPTLIFTVINEAGVSQRIGIGLLNIFFLGSIVILTCMGPFDELERKANEETEGNEEIKNAEEPDNI